MLPRRRGGGSKQGRHGAGTVPLETAISEALDECRDTSRKGAEGASEQMLGDVSGFVRRSISDIGVQTAAPEPLLKLPHFLTPGGCQGPHGVPGDIDNPFRGSDSRQ